MNDHVLGKWSDGLAVAELRSADSASRRQVVPLGSRAVTAASRRNADHEIAHGRATDQDNEVHGHGAV